MCSAVMYHILPLKVFSLSWKNMNHTVTNDAHKTV